MRIAWYHAPTAADELGAERGFLETTDELSELNDTNGWLGRSHRDSDSTSNASYNEVRIWSGALTEADRELLHELGPVL